MIGTIAKLWGAAALVAGASLFAETAAEQPPVPSSETGQENAGGKMAGNLLSGTLMPQIPSNISITNDGAIRVEESRKVIFEGPHVHMVTDTGVEVFPVLPITRVTAGQGPTAWYALTARSLTGRTKCFLRMLSVRRWRD